MNKPYQYSHRASGIELLRIIAIFIIIVSHCVQSTEMFINFFGPTTSISYLIMRVLRHGGHVGNLLFVISSSYFLVDKPKAKTGKAINIMLDSQFISTGLMIAYYITSAVLSLGAIFTFPIFVINVFPDLYSMVWFIPAYVAFYLLHPYLNIIIDNLGKKEHMMLNVCAFLFFGVVLMLQGAKIYSEFLGFFIVYFYVAYIKKYQYDYIFNIKKNIKAFIIMSCVFLGLVLAKNALSFKFPVFSEFPSLGEMTSIVLFPLSMSLFNIFVNFKFKSKLINSVAILSLYMYCIHENYFIRTALRPLYYRTMMENFGKHFLIYAALLSVVIFVFSLIVAAVYHATLHKITQKLSIKIHHFATSLFDKVYTKFSRGAEE